MTEARSDAEIVKLRAKAQEIATSRKERMTTVHLLAAIARDDGPAGALLRERRLDDEVLLKASRTFDDEGLNPMNRVISAARSIPLRHLVPGAPARAAAPAPSALHLLLAILADRAAAAHRSLVHAGVDLARLRAAAIQLSLGVIAPRRSSRPAVLAPAPRPVAPRQDRPYALAPQAASPSQERRPARDDGGAPASAQSGVAVPIMPLAPQAPQRAPSSRPLAPKATPPVSTSPRPPLTTGRAAAFALDRTRFPVLSALGENLSLAAAEGKLAEIVGRDEEIDSVIDVLAKRHASSACIVGAPGVGKTAIARGVVLRVAALDANEPSPRVFIELATSDLTSGPTGRRGLVERFAAARAEAREMPGRVVLFVDDLAEIAADPAFDDAVGELKSALAKGELRLLATSSFEAFQRYVEPDAGLARRLTVVEVEPPDEESAFLLLQRVAVGLAAHHRASIGDDVIAAAVSWTTRYVPGRALPDKALSALDLASARARRLRGDGATLTLADLATIVAELADVPIERLLETDRERMLSLEKTLAERVVGHGAALARIARVVRRNAAGLRGSRPIGSFLLLGPTGVGKTETAKALAEALFHSPDAMTRLDFSEYAEAHSVARLIGAPPGYVGHDAGGQLTEAVRKRPYQVILLDEIEKAHRDVLEAFLQVFDEGRLTDGRGRRVDFTNAVIVMTSNLGAAEVAQLREKHQVGFAKASAVADARSPERLAETMIAAARAHLPPELYNRIDEVLCFAPLARAEVAEVARRLLDGLAATLEDRGIRLEVEREVVDALLDAGGFDPTLGARPMKRTLARLVENPLAELLLRGDLTEGGVALVGVEEGEVMVDALAAESLRSALA